MSHSSGSGAAPVFLRLALGLTFLWAGAGKFMATIPVQGEDAAVLANYGVAVKPTGGAAPVGVPPVPAPESSPKDESKPEGPKGDAAPSTEDDRVFAMLPALRLVPQASAAPSVFTAADFPEPVQVTQYHGITLAVHYAAHPKAGADGKPLPSIWPAFASGGKWPHYLGLMAAVTELVGGALVLVGFMTRIAALGLAGVMAVAMWLTQFGPPWQAGNAYLGFLPPHALFDGAAWQSFFWQFSLLCSAMALMFTGSGALAIDRIMFHRPRPTAMVKAA